MNAIPAHVPGSRRPIVQDSNGNFLSPPQPPQDPYPQTPKPPLACSPSSYRRKPRVTYRSPSSLCPNLRIEGPRPPPPALPPPSSPRPSDPYYIPLSTARLAARPPLPLYHPLGPLATSLPLIDLQSLGLRFPHATHKRLSSRLPKPAPILRDADPNPLLDSSPLALLVSSLPAPSPAPTPPAPTAAEKAPSPRKRRQPAAGGGASKRKRRDHDDPDPSYPAKRTRNTRPPAQPPSEIDSRADSAPPALDIDPDAPGPDDDLPVLPERRSTRSRAAAAAVAVAAKPTPSRRSSVSDETQTSVSVSIAAGRAKKAAGAVAFVTDRAESEDVGPEFARATSGSPLLERVREAAAKVDPGTHALTARELSLPVVPPPPPPPPPVAPAPAQPTNGRFRAREEDQKEEGELSEDDVPFR